MENKQIGKLGEKRAVEYLRNKKYKILEQNWRNKFGEIDIIALAPKKNFWKRDKNIIFIEVKTSLRKNANLLNFQPSARVSAQKRKRLIKMAQLYILKHKLKIDTPRQIDVISVIISDKNLEINHFENSIK